MNEFDDLISGALDARGADAPLGTPDAGDAMSRARHHRAVRRTMAISGVAVLAFAGVAGLMLRSSDGTAPAADAPAVDTPTATQCADGQILSGEGDIVLHEGQSYAVTPGQCLTATLQEPSITSCEVTTVSGSASASGGAPESGTVSESGVVSVGEGKGCAIGGQWCPVPAALPEGTTPDTTVVIKSGEWPPNLPWNCALACGVEIRGGIDATVPDAPPVVVTTFNTADTSASDASSSASRIDPPDAVIQTCAGPPPDVIASAPPVEATATTVEVQG